MAEKFRVRALRSFRAPVDGQMTIVNPGDVVELANRDDFLSVLSTNRAEAAPADAAVKRAKEYLPPYKRDRLMAIRKEAPKTALS